MAALLEWCRRLFLGRSDTRGAPTGAPRPPVEKGRPRSPVRRLRRNDEVEMAIMRERDKKRFMRLLDEAAEDKAP